MQWHHRAQERWGKATLYFWFLTFRLSYDPDVVLPALDEVASEFGLSSFASYELLGMYDIMLRVYMPASKTKRLKTALKSREALSSLDRVDLFRVDEIARHWCWAKQGEIGATHSPEKGVLERRRPWRELERLNEVGEAIEDATRNGGTFEIELDDETEQLIQRYKDERLIVFSNRTRGIKLVILVRSIDTVLEGRRAEVRQALSRILDDPDLPVAERSLYVGEEGQANVLLIMCRVDFEAFHRIRRRFLQSVRDAVAIAGARTMTLVAVSDDFHCFRDALPATAAHPSSREHLELLQDSEGQHLEVKGSVFGDLDPWLTQNGPIEEHDWVALRGVLKSIVGFLNSGGGTVVIGALETGDYVDKGDLVAEKIGTSPKVGPYFCIGLVDPTYAEHDWEHYKRRIGEVVAAKIWPPPGVLVQPRLGSVEDVDVCIIEVADPGPDGDDYYLKEDRKTTRYYGRIDNKTKPMSNDQARQHRRQVERRREIWDA